MYRIGSLLCSFVLLGSLLAAQENVSFESGKPVCEAAFTIPAHSFKTCNFSVRDGQERTQLVGHFSATGGPHNSIEVWVMNDDEFVNWRNHHPVKALYNSRRVTQGTVKIPLSDPGMYHVVFNNDFSVLTPKAVEVQLSLERQ